jgi:hypothetical protein
VSSNRSVAQAEACASGAIWTGESNIQNPTSVRVAMSRPSPGRKKKTGLPEGSPGKRRQARLDEI